MPTTTIAPAPDALARYRTPGVAAVLDAVRATGRTAHAEDGDGVSMLVFAVAVTRGENPVALQREVELYVEVSNELAAL
jgi:hypothetical protein